VVIGFRCGPGGNWLNLWKPTIDALGPLVGEGNRRWNPRDGTIVDLALHLQVDSGMRWDVDIFIRVTPTYVCRLPLVPEDTPLADPRSTDL
jgi:hypothetical protein